MSATAGRARELLRLALIVAIAGCSSLSRSDDNPANIWRVTGSLALDRITKREPLLDGIERRRGSGRGVTIYVFDGGIDTSNSELRGRVRVGFDAFPAGRRVCNSHGTAVAGAAAGRNLGVARDADVVDVKIIDCRLVRGTIPAIVAAADWAIADHARHPGRPAIANWSFITDSTGRVPEIDAAVERLHAAGILVVVAAGNLDADACRLSPANSPRALVVGSSSVVLVDSGRRLRDVRTKGTAFGACIDLYAPGDSVLLPGAHDGGEMTLWRGTSMSAGFVSGAAALVLERHPGLTPDSLSAIIIRGATAGAVANVGAGERRARLLYVGLPDQ